MATEGAAPPELALLRETAAVAAQAFRSALLCGAPEDARRVAEPPSQRPTAGNERRHRRRGRLCKHWITKRRRWHVWMLRCGSAGGSGRAAGGKGGKGALPAQLTLPLPLFVSPQTAVESVGEGQLTDAVIQVRRWEGWKDEYASEPLSAPVQAHDCSLAYGGMSPPPLLQAASQSCSRAPRDSCRT